VAQLYPQAPSTQFSRLLRHAWVTVGLFLFPGHHTGSCNRSASCFITLDLRLFSCVAWRASVRPKLGPLSLEVKRLGREADHSPPSSVGGQRMRGAIPPLPQYAFMAWCLVKHRDNFTFTLSTGRVSLRPSVLNVATAIKVAQRHITVPLLRFISELLSCAPPN
jgi:hypothetical protein